MGKGRTRMRADTPRTPGPRNVDFHQFCDRLRTDLPDDSHGRGSFDRSARYVARDPGAKFGATAPLEYEVTGEIGHPHWAASEEASSQHRYTTEQIGERLKHPTCRCVQTGKGLSRPVT